MHGIILAWVRAFGVRSQADRPLDGDVSGQRRFSAAASAKRDWNVKKTLITAMRISAAPLAISIASLAAPAMAQDAAEPVLQPGADEDEMNAIVVTGSRIQRRDITSTSPLAVIAEEEFSLSGAVNVEQVINTLPQVVPGVTSFSNNPGNGAATLDLRGLGETRTMVLVNGRRWMFYDAAQIVDLNTIPQFLIDSVDVVTGGASAVYGSDALAGVVNFRLRHAEGLELGAQYQLTEEGDGDRMQVHGSVGGEFAGGRGRATAFAEYYKRTPIFQAGREATAFALGDGDGELVPGGSAVVPYGRLIDFGGSYPTLSDVVFRTPGTATPTAGDTYNYAPANYLMLPQERFLAGAFADYEISPHATVFGELSFVNNRVQQELAATPVTGFFDINADGACQNLDAPTCARFRAAAAEGGDPDIIEDIFVLRRTIESGSRNSFDERNAFRVLAGLRGDVTDSIQYETSYTYARTRNANIQQGNISRSAFSEGLLDATNPLNIYGPDTLSEDDVERISILAQNNDISQLHVATAFLSGDLFTLGTASDAIGFALGMEWRDVEAQFVPDTALSSGDVIGFNAGDPTEGGYSVTELFGELRVPIIQDGFVDRLEVNGAARYSDYSLEAVGAVWTYAAGIELAPIPDITFRGQYQRAVRAPNVGELFGGQAIGFPPATDPCATPAAASGQLRDLCIATGVPATTVGTPSVQLNPQIPSIFGGNPDLTEETSDTWTVGAVIQPRFIPRLTLTVDYFNIKIDDTISVLGGSASNVLNLCYNVIQDPSSAYCQAINRNASGIISGEEFSIEVLNANIAGLEASGIDFQLDYNQPLGFSMFGESESRLNFFFLGTWTEEANFIPVQALPDQVNECAGTFGLICGEPTPEWKWTSRLSWVDGPLTTSLRWRHVGALNDDDPDSEYVVEHIGSYDLFDLSFGYDLSETVTLAAGVRNLFDEDFTLLGDNQEQANTYPGTYDVLGRDYFVSVGLKF
jgi:outer membrane receptor protein involved in Fe transport